MGINKPRVLLGGFLGGIVWLGWSFFIYSRITPLLTVAQQKGLFLAKPRYSYFPIAWIITLFVLAILVSYLYAAVRSTLGPGPWTAFKVGALVGFAAGFPDNFGMAAWSPADRVIPLGFMLEMWAGAILATIVAGWIYKQAGSEKAARAAA
jgi:hypothetical protein